MHHTGTLGWQGRDARGRPIAAVINSLASRNPLGTGIFIAATPRPGVTDMRSKVGPGFNPVEKTAIAGWRASMAARNLNPHTQRSHISSCRRFAAWLKRSPDTAAADEVRRFELHLIESGESICNRNRIMTGVRFLFRVTLRRHALAAEVWHLKEPQKLPPVLSPEEVKRVLTMATSLKAVLRYLAVDR